MVMLYQLNLHDISQERFFDISKIQKVTVKIHERAKKTWVKSPCFINTKNDVAKLWILKALEKKILVDFDSHRTQPWHKIPHEAGLLAYVV